MNVANVPMAKTLKDSFQKLYEVADTQGGYFTAKQATDAGFSTRMQAYHAQSGDWEREWRGIYRLRFYPNPRPDDLMVWYLWSSDRSGKPEGVYSHDTALELYELSTWSGKRLHMTVPKEFKRRSLPEALRLHYTDLRHFEITKVKQVAVTTVVRTFLDLLHEEVLQRHHLLEAMQDARKRGLIAPSDLESPWLTKHDRHLLQRLNSESCSYSTEA
jgi:predicted transcriptional regulator of viral defense system